MKIFPCHTQIAALFSALCLSLALASCQTKPSVVKAPPANPSAVVPAAPTNQPVTTRCVDERILNGVQMSSTTLNVKVQFYADNVVRVVKWTPNGTSEKASLVVIQTNLPDLKIDFQETAETITLGSGKITLQLSKGDGAIQYLARDGQTILKEQGEAVITPVKIEHETNAFSVRQNFKLTPDEGIYGLGQHQSGFMNYRGHTVKLVQANTEAVTPFLISTRNYGIRWDNYSKTIFADDHEKTSLWSDVSDNVDYYFIYGKNMDDVIAGYRNLTGAGADVRQMGLRLLAKQGTLRDPR